MTAPRPKRLTRMDNRPHRLIRRRQLQRIDERDTLREQRTRRTPGATGARKPAKAVRLDATLERLLQDRAAGRCECCGHALRGRCQRHHRKLKSQGGLNDVTNLVVICANCHNTIHLNPQWSTEHGWIVPAHQHPARVKLTLWDNRRVRLTTTGSYQQAAA
jgi:hypothetical protein